MTKKLFFDILPILILGAIAYFITNRSNKRQEPMKIYERRIGRYPVKIYLSSLFLLMVITLLILRILKIVTIFLPMSWR
jgi:hypothetical protein